MDQNTGKRNLRPEKPSFSYAESDVSTSPGARSDASSFGQSPQSSKTSPRLRESDDSEDDLHNDDVDELGSDDVIRGTCRVQ